MPKITVKAKIDGGVHLKYGPIIKGQEYSIEEEDFGSELFERPQGFESPHERADRERLKALEREASDLETDSGLAPAAPPSTPKPSKKTEGSE